MTTRSMGRGITLTKDMYKKMGKKAEVRAQSRATAKGDRLLAYTSERIDPRSHVRFC